MNQHSSLGHGPCAHDERKPGTNDYFIFNATSFYNVRRYADCRRDSIRIRYQISIPARMKLAGFASPRPNPSPPIFIPGGPKIEISNHQRVNCEPIFDPKPDRPLQCPQPWKKMIDEIPRNPKSQFPNPAGSCLSHIKCVTKWGGGWGKQ